MFWKPPPPLPLLDLPTWPQLYTQQERVTGVHLTLTSHLAPWRNLSELLQLSIRWRRWPPRNGCLKHILLGLLNSLQNNVFHLLCCHCHSFKPPRPPPIEVTHGFRAASRMKCPPALFASEFCDSQQIFLLLGWFWLVLKINKNLIFNARQILQAWWIT